MRKLSFSLILVLLALVTNVEFTKAEPDIRGDYSGSYNIVVSNCTNSSHNGTYNADLEINIPTQSGNTFNGTATGTLTNDNLTLIGGWLFNPGSLANSAVLTIIDDTNYMFVVDGEPDDGGGRGMERGTYTWDSTTGAFAATAISKTLGDWGVSSLGEMTVSVNANTLNVTESIEGPFSLTKIFSATNSIVGSWLFNPGSLADSAVLTFIDDNNYMFAVDGEPDDGGGRGMERGTYSWNPSTGAFNATAISGTVGDWGVSYLTDPTASVDENTLTIIDGNDGPIPFTKVEIVGFAAEEYIQLSGTITETGQISGNTSHAFLSTGGAGTFTGQLSGNTISILNPGQDTYGDTCTYTRTMSATRSDISKGDIDNSGQVELLDAVLVLQIINGISPSVPIYSRADINNDSKLDQAEAIYALQSAASLRHEIIVIDVAAYANSEGRWEYQNTEPGYMTPSVEVIGTGIKNGKEVYILQEYDPVGHPNDQHYYLTDMSSGLYNSGGINNYQDPDQEIFYWEPEMPYLLASFVPGEEYPFQSTRIPDNATVTGTISIQPESVTVPASTFTDCYKVTLAVSYEGESSTFFMWYAKNVGLVKRVGFGGGTWELTSYTP